MTIFSVLYSQNFIVIIVLIVPKITFCYYKSEENHCVCSVLYESSGGKRIIMRGAKGSVRKRGREKGGGEKFR